MIKPPKLAANHATISPGALTGDLAMGVLATSAKSMEGATHVLICAPLALASFSIGLAITSLLDMVPADPTRCYILTLLIYEQFTLYLVNSGNTCIRSPSVTTFIIL